MNHQPLVSVLMPIFNGARHLPEALESIRSQTYQNLEIILINDGSNDDSGIIIDEFARVDQRAFVIHKSNSGLIDTLNRGLNAASGDWLARLDQDDFAQPNRIERQVETVLGTDRPILVGSDFRTLNEESRRLRRYRLPSDHEQLVTRLRRVQRFFPHSSAMFHVSTAQKVGGYDTSANYNEDWDLWLRLSEHGRIASIGEDLVTVRKHETQMTRNSGSVFPLGEAFVSSVLHLMRVKATSYYNNLGIQPEMLRATVRQSREFQEFCELLKRQEQFLSDSGLVGLIVSVLVQLLQRRTNLDNIMRSFMYALRGTNTPEVVAARLLNSLSVNSHGETNKKSH